MLSCASAKEETTCCPDSKVKVFADGTCEWYREFRLSVSHCDIDITWFPFDSQVCDMIYESKNHDNNELNISRMAPEAALDSYSKNGEWELRGITSTTTTRKPLGCYHITCMKMSTACKICIACKCSQDTCMFSTQLGYAGIATSVIKVEF